MRRTALVLSVVLHALALLGLSTAAFPPRSVENPHPDVVWMAPPLAASPPNAVEPPPTAATRPEPQAMRPERPPRQTEPADRIESAGASIQARPPPLPPPSASPPAPAAPEQPAPDLFEASRRAAAEVLAERNRAGSYRSLTFPGTLAEQQAFEEAERFRRAERGRQAPLTAFDSPAKGRAGITETTPFGRSVRWVSDDCYQTVGSDNPFLLPSTAWMFAIPMTNCTTPPARGDLFASAKPDYLLDADARAAAAAERARRERLRRPTTGVVMSLEEE
jgi:hypothetical protein